MPKYLWLHVITFWFSQESFKLKFFKYFKYLLHDYKHLLHLKNIFII